MTLFSAMVSLSSVDSAAKACMAALMREEGLSVGVPKELSAGVQSMSVSSALSSNLHDPWAVAALAFHFCGQFRAKWPGWLQL
jgi:hypothetical protein